MAHCADPARAAVCGGPHPPWSAAVSAATHRPTDSSHVPNPPQIVHPDVVGNDVWRLKSIPRSAPVPGRSNVKIPPNAGIPFSDACPWHPLLHVFSGGEGWGEEALLKTSPVANPQFYWFVGSNIKIPANAGLYPSPDKQFSPISHLGNPPIRRLTSILWPERTLRFATALLNPGENEMTFTVPGGDLQSGVKWDYLHLEPADN